MNEQKPTDDLELDALVIILRGTFKELIQVAPNLTEEHSGMLSNIQKPNRLADRAISLLTLSNSEKQTILEEMDVINRCEEANTILSKEIERIKLGEEIQSEVQDEIAKSQREYYLREQLKAIRKELGEDEGSVELTELEEKVTDWIKDAVGIPTSWKGVINDTASIGSICSLLTARECKTDYLTNLHGLKDNKFKVYCSKEAHSSIEKAVKTIGIGSKNLKKISTNSDLSMNCNELEIEIKRDIKKTNIPLAIVTTFGTTGTVAFDSINEIAKVAKKYKIWHHIDAAYAGSVLLLDEYKGYIENLKLADTFIFNPHKWMLTNFDCSLYYVKDKTKLIKTLEIHPEYLRSTTKEKINNYKDWSLQLGRRFRALKLWFVIRTFGINGIKKYLRNHIKLAKDLNSKIIKNKDFEITANQNIIMINFRYNPKSSKYSDKDLNYINKNLVKKLNKTGKIYISHTIINGVYSIRMPIASTTIEKNNLDNSWELIQKISKNIIK